MKQLILVRHAKSSWEHDVKDHQRPLKNRGISDAQLVAREFADYQLIPDRIFSSDAKRAQSTAEIFLKTLQIDSETLQLEPTLYDFNGEHVEEFVKNLSDSIKTVMIIGHNFAFTWFVNTYGSKYTGNVPTSGLTFIRFDINSWKELQKGKTISSIYPKDVK